ncbi:4005_t:CDS:2 [Paraglomus occultum]|uniref:4005_t:CDS:1 n=1 Tax=Paraglomus occultum TaxID=144539 RepID=A0A9N9GNP0_9GLOM|nr:4005_t:CDS:2 [Paraglomus occultum]
MKQMLPNSKEIAEGKQGINPNAVKFQVYEPKEFQEEKYRKQFAFHWTNMERAYGIRHDTLENKEERASVSEVFSSQANFDAQEKKIYRLLWKRKVVLAALAVNVLTVAIFAGYTITMRKDQLKLKKENQAIRKELAEVERVNGKEKRDIAELQAKVSDELKKNQVLIDEGYESEKETIRPKSPRTMAELDQAQEEIKELKKIQPETVSQAAEQVLIEANQKIRELQAKNKSLNQTITELKTPSKNQAKEQLFTCFHCQQE